MWRPARSQIAVRRHFAKQGVASQRGDAASGAPADPVLVAARAGRRVDGPGFRLAAGPPADDRAPTRLAFADRDAA